LEELALTGAGDALVDRARVVIIAFAIESATAGPRFVDADVVLAQIQGTGQTVVALGVQNTALTGGGTNAGRGHAVIRGAGVAVVAMGVVGAAVGDRVGLAEPVDARDLSALSGSAAVFDLGAAVCDSFVDTFIEHARVRCAGTLVRTIGVIDATIRDLGVDARSVVRTGVQRAAVAIAALLVRFATSQALKDARVVHARVRGAIVEVVAFGVQYAAVGVQTVLALVPIQCHDAGIDGARIIVVAFRIGSGAAATKRVRTRFMDTGVVLAQVDVAQVLVHAVCVFDARDTLPLRQQTVGPCFHEAVVIRSALGADVVAYLHDFRRFLHRISGFPGRRLHGSRIRQRFFSDRYIGRLFDVGRSFAIECVPGGYRAISAGVVYHLGCTASRSKEQ